MRKLVCMLSLAVASVVANAQVFPSGFFPAFPPYIDGFDTLVPGSYTGFPMFAGNGGMARIGALNAMVVSNLGGIALTAPNYNFGRGCDVQMKVSPPMTYFGGFFQRAPAGIAITTIKFAFYDIFNVLIGSVAVPCPASWTWIGWKTSPQWQRVEIYGIGGALPGYVAMDEIRVN